jgi:hypothetical protein
MRLNTSIVRTQPDSDTGASSASVPVIKGFQGIKGTASCLCSCLKGLPSNAFAFEPMKEALHRRMIVTISRTTHTHDHALLLQKRLLAFTGGGPPTIALLE